MENLNSVYIYITKPLQYAKLHTLTDSTIVKMNRSRFLGNKSDTSSILTWLALLSRISIIFVSPQGAQSAQRGTNGILFLALGAEDWKSNNTALLIMC